MVDQGAQRFPIMNEKYELRRELGEGKTSKVYLANEVGNPAQKYAIKILKNDYIENDEKAQDQVIKEVAVLETLKHKGIVGIFDYGDDGKIIKASGKEKLNVVYIVLEYIAGGLLFEVCQDLGPLGEDCSRVFFKEIVEAIEFMQSMSISHRDLKLENILIDQSLSIKVADFGFATENPGLLDSYKGTPVYMAPEIALGKKYSGFTADLFSAGVILFTLARGIFPFMNSNENDQFYVHLLNKDYGTYWEQVQATDASAEFKDLIHRLLAHDPAERPSMEKLKLHPWMTADGASSDQAIKQTVAEKIMKVREDKRKERAKANEAKQNKAEAYNRGENDGEEQFISKTVFTQPYNHADLTEWGTTMKAAEFWEKIEEMAGEIDHIDAVRDAEKRKFELVGAENNVRIKVKFFEAPEEKTLKISFIKKQGDLLNYYKLLKDAQDYLLEHLVSRVE